MNLGETSNTNIQNPRQDSIANHQARGVLGAATESTDGYTGTTPAQVAELSEAEWYTLAYRGDDAPQLTLRGGLNLALSSAESSFA